MNGINSICNEIRLLVHEYEYSVFSHSLVNTRKSAQHRMLFGGDRHNDAPTKLNAFWPREMSCKQSHSVHKSLTRADHYTCGTYTQAPHHGTLSLDVGHCDHR